jgi:hypothetical protein
MYRLLRRLSVISEDPENITCAQSRSEVERAPSQTSWAWRDSIEGNSRQTASPIEPTLLLGAIEAVHGVTIKIYGVGANRVSASENRR